MTTETSDVRAVDENGVWPFVSDVTLAGIPSTYLAQPDRGDAPMVLFSNGFGAPRSEAVLPGIPQNRISPRLVAGMLTAGYRILVPENPGHGERLGDAPSPFDALARCARGEGADLLRTAMEETPALIDGAVSAGLVGRAEDVVIVGHSWGGLHAILRLLGDARIRGGVALIPVIEPTSLPALAEFGAQSRLADLDLTELTRKHLAGRPLSLLAGQTDWIAPAALAHRFAVRLRADPDGAGDAVEYEEMSDAGHGYHARELDHVMEWLAHVAPVDQRAVADG